MNFTLGRILSSLLNPITENPREYPCKHRLFTNRKYRTSPAHKYATLILRRTSLGILQCGWLLNQSLTNTVYWSRVLLSGCASTCNAQMMWANVAYNGAKHTGLTDICRNKFPPMSLIFWVAIMKNKSLP